MSMSPQLVVRRRMYVFFGSRRWRGFDKCWGPFGRGAGTALQPGAGAPAAPVGWVRVDCDEVVLAPLSPPPPHAASGRQSDRMRAVVRRTAGRILSRTHAFAGCATLRPLPTRPRGLRV